MIFTLFIFYKGPGSSPLNLKIKVINSSTLQLSWTQPLIPNGIITKYTINCRGENNKNHTVVTSTTMILVLDLSPYTNYTCFVFGHTRVGMGPPITEIGVTDEDSECVYILCVYVCVTLKSGPMLFFLYSVI